MTFHVAAEDDQADPGTQMMDKTRIQQLASSLGRDLDDAQLRQAMVDMGADDEAGDRHVTMEAFHRWWDRLGGDAMYDNAAEDDDGATSDDWVPEERLTPWRANALTSYKVCLCDACVVLAG